MNNRIALLALPLVLAACAVATPVPTAAPTAAPTATRPPATAIPPAAAPTAAPTATAVPPTATPRPAPGTVTVMTHDSFAMSKAVLAAFEAETGITVKVLKAGDVGSALNKAILTKDAPLADVFYGVDNTFLSRALSAGIFDPYAAPALRTIADRYKLDPQNRLLPVDYGHVAVNYDRAWFETKKLALPATLKDLADPKYKGLLVVENPATSSPGLAFLLATIASFPEGSAYTWQQYWADLRKNDVRAAEGWEAAYYGDFSGSSGKGPRPLVVSYQTSPAAEVMFSEGKLSAPPTGNLDAAAFEQIEFVGI
ncbi:MAG: thiamine ABC transporter substrate-binding protein, partial [Thermoflexales bacterium]|nr:thiamine ABC transporter substrate-binding protein [Thermoflexales bacterium]